MNRLLPVDAEIPGETGSSTQPDSPPETADVHG